MEVIGTVAAFIGILVLLVLVHELGHFLVAKRAGITVEEFGIGFPPRIGSVTWRGTRYSLNWIPLGGFVRMLGEDGNVEIRRLREQGLTEAEIDRAMEGAFNRRPIWVRARRTGRDRGNLPAAWPPRTEFMSTAVLTEPVHWELRHAQR